MRFPIYLADWPETFNSAAKFYAAHYPNRSFKMNKAREALAYLLGYNSVHEVQQQLAAPVINKDFSLLAAIRSMTVRAMVRYHAEPKVMADLLHQLPWKAFEVWNHVGGWNDAYFTDGDLLEDEANRITFGYEAYKARWVPRNAYAVDRQGRFYLADYFKKLLYSVSLSRQDMVDSGFNDSVSKFMHDVLIPNAWLDIFDEAGNVHPLLDKLVKDELEQASVIVASKIYKTDFNGLLPFSLELEVIPNDVKSDEDVHYSVFHCGYQAYYPGAYTKDELYQALLGILIGDKIKASNSLNSTTSFVHPLKREKYYDIEIDGQMFFRKDWRHSSPNHFSDFSLTFERIRLDNFWVRKHLDRYATTQGVAAMGIDTSCIPATVQMEFLFVEEWLHQGTFEAMLKLDKLDEDAMVALINTAFNGTSDSLPVTYQDIAKSLHSDVDLIAPITFQANTTARSDADSIKLLSNPNTETEKSLFEIGQSVLMVAPELGQFFEPEALGAIIKDANLGSDGPKSVRISFIVMAWLFQLSHAGVFRLRETDDSIVSIGTQMMLDVAEGNIAADEVGNALTRAADLALTWRLYSDQFEQVKYYYTHRPKVDEQYVICGTDISGEYFRQ